MESLLIFKKIIFIKLLISLLLIFVGIIVFLNEKQSLSLFRIILFGFFIIYENKMIPEEISDREILIRIGITLAAMGYIYFEEFMEEKTLVIINFIEVINEFT